MDIIKQNKINAIILDLDGVVTSTADLHERAWKRMFDLYLNQISEKENKSFGLFSHEDYKLYVDGKTRFEGADDFLRSRNIVLSFGFTDDPSGFNTVCSLANQKNLYYQELLKSEGVFVYPDTREMLTIWKIQDYKIGLFSSSKNCREVISLAGLGTFFDVIVDGNDLIQLHLKGKPEPDMLIYTTEKLGTTPENTIVIEDAPSGVEAGKRGNFKQVVGVNRNGNAHLLKVYGADIVVLSLKELRPAINKRKISEVHFLSQSLHEIKNMVTLNSLVLFIDYDGTLTPIAKRPELATLSQNTRNILARLSQKCVIAIISGRDRHDVEQMIQLNSLYYAGDHGFDIAGPDGLSMVHPLADIAQPYLSRAERFISESIGNIKGILIERKRFTIAVHYRMVNDLNITMIKKELEMIKEKIGGLRLTEGKKVFEFRPDIDWNKGNALLWLIEKIPIQKRKRVFFYLGDDITDEDAFKEINGIGTSILVGSYSGLTFAEYRLEDVTRVQYFLEEINRLV